MRFISVREFRGKSGDVWKELTEEQVLVITSNGKPIAIVSAVSEETLADSLRAIRRARAMAALAAMQRVSAKRFVCTRCTGGQCRSSEQCRS